MWTDFEKYISGTTQHPGVEWTESDLSQLKEVIDNYVAEWTEDSRTHHIRATADMAQQYNML